MHNTKYKSKPIVFILIILIIVGFQCFVKTSFSQLSNTVNTNNDIDNAIKILTSTQPMKFPSFEMSQPEKDGEVAQALYKLQMEAIDLIYRNKAEGCVKYLIPFMHYNNRNPFDDIVGKITKVSEKNKIDINSTRKQWPVFSMIIEMPGAAQSLKDYALQRNNPDNIRFEAYNALRYLDLKKCKMVGELLSKEFSNSTLAQEYIKGVESDQIFFGGTKFNPR